MKSGKLVLTLSLVAIATVAVHAGRPVVGNDSVANSPSTSPQDDKPAEQVYKNIQVFKSLPNSQLMTVMHFMRTSLGVRCDYCHVAENGKYWMDDKPPKQTARRMIEMVAEINKANFGGQQVVTCNTCHRGQTKPLAVPAIGQGAFANTTRDDSDAKPPDPLPAIDDLLDRYSQAIGGKAAAQKITTRVIKLSWLRPKVVNAGTPKAAAVARGDTWPMEIYQKAPNKYLAVITSPNGIILQGFNGTSGWVKSPQGQREMNVAETARVARLADLLADFKLKERYAQMTVTGKEKIGDREVYVVEAVEAQALGAQASLPAPSEAKEARRPAVLGVANSTPAQAGMPALPGPLQGRSERLFFDTQSGLLLRRIVLTPTALGLDPEQTDFQDYKDVDGVKLPFTIVVSYLDDSHLGTTRKYIEVKHNVPIDDAKFEQPGR